VKPSDQFPAVGQRCDRCIADAAAAWRAANPERQALWRAVRDAVRDGLLTKPDACEACGAPGYIEGHHDDYSKPLEVRWLCSPCHKEQHGKKTGGWPKGKKRGPKKAR
jgi:hypothetical protein